MLVYILLGMIAMLIVALVWALTRQPVNQQLLRQNQELLNRLQSPDLRTFLALQTSSTTIPETEVISQDDIAEAMRTPSNYGPYLTDEEVRQYSLSDMSDFSFPMDSDK
jgi:Na+-translocating ferredoxin:NAD+ oxidoreductase RnfG subunit